MTQRQFSGRLFLFTGVPFGVLFGSVSVFQDGLVSGIVSGFIGGLFFGLFIAVVMTKLQSAAIREQGWPDTAYNVKHYSAIELEISPSAAFERAARAIAQLPVTVIASDPIAKEITAKFPISWKSWGETVNLHIEDSPSGSIARISSSPRMPFTIADYGKNRKNVERVAALLAQNAAA